MASSDSAIPGDIFKILIVDDEKDVLVALHMTLMRSRQFKCAVRVAEDSNAAWAELESDVYDLVMSDYKMPGENGVDFLAKVKERYPGVIRILITGYSEMRIAKDAINRADVHFFLEKPWDNEGLRTLVGEALSLRGRNSKGAVKETDGGSVVDDLPMCLSVFSRDGDTK